MSDRKEKYSPERKRITILFVILFLLMIPCIVFSDGYAQSNEPQDSLSKYIDLVGKTIVGRFGLRYTLDKYGIPTSITGDLNKGLTGTDVVEKSYQFFELNKDIFQVVDSRKEFIVRGVINEGPSTVKFYWAVNGVKVQYGGYFLHFNKNGALYTVEGQIDPEARKINTNPAISEEQAKRIALDDPKHKDAKPEISSIELLTGRIDGELRLFWSIGIINGGGVGSWNYKVDAQTGKILVCESAIIY
jgi:hypothetical protein